MTELGLKQWVDTYCDKKESAEDIKTCIDEKGNQSFHDIVMSQSHNISHHKAEVQSLNGVVQFLTLNDNSIPYRFPYFLLSLKPEFQYTILFIDPSFQFLSPNPLAVKKTALRLPRRANSVLIYFQVFVSSIMFCLQIKSITL